VKITAFFNAGTEAKDGAFSLEGKKNEVNELSFCSCFSLVVLNQQQQQPIEIIN